ncbi:MULTISPECIES: hypothetical protein [Roseateles]|uniref:Uncharacterized protein n=1 Tax=Roseateles albus TaxID=2987525 RepID=A0ABT5K9K7_9BURK|nr:MULTISPECIES: hypothetical protein [Roseateles]MCV2357574.1 hypothetical protein [Paucibacter sp. TC2R-5]MDC8770636.1 hypothetical protein [Roseateles albus]
MHLVLELRVMAAAHPQRSELPRPKPDRSRLLVAGLCILLSLGPLLWWLWLKPSGMAVELVSKTWRLDIEIEKLLEEGESSWCDEMPAEARNINRRLILDPSGARPDPAEHCRFTRPQWRTMRMSRAEGAAPAPPQWPEPKLNGLPADQLGAERAGKREAFYELLLQNDTEQVWTCRLPLAQWQAHRLGARYRVQVDRFGVANCASLPKPA